MESGSVLNRYNRDNAIKHTNVSEQEIIKIDNAIYRKRDMTCWKLKAKFRLEASLRSINRYVRRLGWRKVTIQLDNLSSKYFLVINKILDSNENLSSCFN